MSKIKKKEVIDSPDGRRRRGSRSRQRIVDALLDLIKEGSISPSAEAVAKRAKVGLRTVFRHFDDMEALYAEMSEVLELTMHPIYSKPLKATAWPDRLYELVDVLAKIYEIVMPYWIAGDVHAHTSAITAAGNVRSVRMHRHAIERALPDNLRNDRDLVDELVLVTCFDTWRWLRKRQFASAARSREIISRLAKAVLAYEKK